MCGVYLWLYHCNHCFLDGIDHDDKIDDDEKQDLGCAVSNFPWSTDLISSLSALKCPLPSTDSGDGNDHDYDIGFRYGTIIIRSNSFSTDFVDDQLN